MPGITARLILTALLASFGMPASAQEEMGESEVIISVADQRMVVLRDGMWVQKYKVSTSKFGLGDSFGSYKTPLGRHRICDKIGDGLPAGAVIKQRNATGEILPVNAPGRDPIVTRILWLEGLEQRNANARSRGIYIHGTVEEDRIGDPVSYGCIRMKSRDVIDAFEHLPLGTIVTIQQEKLPHYKRWSAPPQIIMVSRTAPKMLGKVSEKTAEPEKKRPPERSEPEPANVKLVATKHTGKVSENAASPHEQLSNSAANSASEPRVTFGGAAALAALKGSILFSDLPGHEPNTQGLKKTSPAKSVPESQPKPEPIAENLAEAEQLPRVSFRAPVNERALPQD